MAVYVLCLRSRSFILYVPKSIIKHNRDSSIKVYLNYIQFNVCLYLYVFCINWELLVGGMHFHEALFRI